MTATILETSHGTLRSTVAASRGGMMMAAGGERPPLHGPSYLTFSITNAPTCFWDAIKELNDCLLKARLSGHQILIKQGCFLKMHGAHVQVRLNNAADLEKLIFSQPAAKQQRMWADDEDEEPL